jgi:hypothetical protein
MVEHEILADAVRERTARLSSDWSRFPKPRRRVRLTLGRWLIGAGRRLSSEPGSGLAHEALPRSTH